MSANSTQLFDYPPTVELLRSFLPSKAVLSEEDAFKKAWRIYMYLRTIYGDGISLGHGKYINSPLASKNTSYKFSFFEWLTQLHICLSIQSQKQSKNYNINNARSKKQDKAEERDNAEYNIDLLLKLTIEDIWYHIFDSQEKRDKWLDCFKNIYRITEQKVEDLLKLHPFDSQGSNFTNRTRLYRLDFQRGLANAQQTHWLQPNYKLEQNNKKKLIGNYSKIEPWFQLIPDSLKEEDSQKYRNQGKRI